MIRTVIWFIFFWIRLLFTIPLFLVVKSMDEITRYKYVDKLAKKFMKTLMWIAGAKVEVIGKPIEDDGVLYVGNHKSYMDIPTMILSIPRSVAFVSKIENKKLPIIYPWMKKMGCIFFERDNIRQQAKSILEGEKVLKSGQNMVIFPEGTITEFKMAEFKAGAMKLATRTGVKIQPFAIIGSANVMGYHTFWIYPNNIKVIFGEPITDYDNDTIKLTQRVRDSVAQLLIEHGGVDEI